jgi:hypothetical protein
MSLMKSRNSLVARINASFQYQGARQGFKSATWLLYMSFGALVAQCCGQEKPTEGRQPPVEAKSMASGVGPAKPKEISVQVATVHSATVYLEVDPRQRQGAIKAPPPDRLAEEQAVYAANQIELLKERFILQYVTREPEVNSLASIKKLDPSMGSMAWISDCLTVKKRGTNFIQVTATLPDAEEATVVVRAVVKCYFREVVDVDRKKRAERLASLNQIAAAKETELRDKLTELKSLEAQNDNSGRMAITVRGMKQDIENIKRILAGVADERVRLRDELAVPPRIRIVEAADVTPKRK